MSETLQVSMLQEPPDLSPKRVTRPRRRRVSVDMSGVNWQLLRDQRGLVETLAARMRDEATSSELDGVAQLIAYLQESAADQIGDEAVYGTDELSSLPVAFRVDEFVWCSVHDIVHAAGADQDAERCMAESPQLHAPLFRPA